MPEISLSQALAWRKILATRHSELQTLRNENSAKEKRFYGATDREVIKEPLYDPKKLDKLITRIALEIRRLDDAVKATNASTKVEGYSQDDGVLGELE